jgi:hypothetical protein
MSKRPSTCSSPASPHDSIGPRNALASGCSAPGGLSGRLADGIARRGLQPHVFVDPRRRTGIDRSGIDHLSPLEHRKAICKSKDEG